MIDLHIHTNHSDGKYSVSEILKKAQETGLNTISITDHDSCKAYYDLENKKIRSLFKGNIKTGIEMTTAYNGNNVEVLGYDFDNYQGIDDYFEKFKQNTDWNKILLNERIILLKKLNKLNIKYDSKFNTNLLAERRYEASLYKSILELNDESFLRKIFGKCYCDNTHDFFRKCITNNADSPLHSDYGKYFLKIGDVIDLIHSNNGKVFLAHPYRYKIENINSYIEKLYNDYNFDGIECYYSTFTKEQIVYLENFAKQRNLLISGGSDYHGIPSKSNELGKINNNTEFIPDSIIENWPK